MSKINYDQLKLITKGSVKDIYLWKEGTPGKPNELLFRFTDDTSVRDYGKLPFTIPGKGEAICAMSVENFIALKNIGINTVYIDQVDKDAIIVKEVAIVDPDKNDMSKFKNNVLIPLEIIARNVVTATSSAKKRLFGGTLHPWQLGLTNVPENENYPVILPMTFIDGSTKLRKSGDEYLPWDELIGMCKLPMRIANQMNILTRQINEYALDKGARSGFLIFDFKVEYAFDENGELVLTDVPLAVDEITCAYTGKFNDISEFADRLIVFQPGVVHDISAYVNTSKQIIRDHYDAAEPEWISQLNAAKAKRLPKAQYPVPNVPPQKLIDLSSAMFKGLANAWTDNNNFDVAPLETTVGEYKQWAKDFYALRK